MLCFSISDERVISTTFPHHSPPTVLAISRDSNILITAAARPGVVYVHNLECLTAPPIVHPKASSTPVTGAAFHPERNNVFLLCFVDGTIALYYISSHLGGNGAETKQNHFIGLHGLETSCFKRLHKVNSVGAEHDSSRRSTVETSTRKPDLSNDQVGNIVYTVTGAAFVRGYQSRAVSVGADGKCRLIDFENGGKLLRTWHIGAPATCLSVLCLDGVKPVREPPRRRKNSREEKIMDYLIAIGRTDGIVMLYDSVGLLLQERSLSEGRSRVISIDWSPDCKIDGMPEADDIMSEDTIINIPTPDQLLGSTLSGIPSAVQSTFNLGMPLTAKKPPKPIVNIDGDQFETVITKPADAHGPGKLEVGPSGKFVDLFSSAKKTIQQRKAFRIRPRLSSSTFKKNSQNSEKRTSVTKKYNLAKNCRSPLIAKCQRLALDGQNSELRAEAKICNLPCREFSKEKTPELSQHEVKPTYLMPGSYYSSVSSSHNDSVSRVSGVSQSNRDAQMEINKLLIPRSESSTSSLSSPMTSDDLHETIISISSRSGRATSTLGQSSDEQCDLRSPNNQVPKDNFSATSSNTNHENKPGRPRSDVTGESHWDERNNQPKSLPFTPNMHLPHLTAENLLRKQANVLGTSSDQLPRLTGFGSVGEKYSRFDEIANWTEAKQPSKKDSCDNGGYNDLSKGMIRDSPTKTKHIECSSGQKYCAYVEKELHQLHSRIDSLTEKITDIHHLVRVRMEDESSMTE